MNTVSKIVNEFFTIIVALSKFCSDVFLNDAEGKSTKEVNSFLNNSHISGCCEDTVMIEVVLSLSWKDS